MKQQKEKLIFKYRTIISTIVLAAIIASAACKPETANFRECEVWPEQRCTNDSVRAHWTTSPDTPIKIKYPGKEISAPGHGDHLISASDFNALPSEVDIVFKIDIEGGEERTKKVRTIYGFDTYERTGVDVGDYRYKVDLPPQIWSEDIHVYKLELIFRKSYQCTGSLIEHDLKWQFDKGMNISDYLLPDNEYQISFDPQPKAAGVWYFTLENPGDEHSCAGWELLNLTPIVEFTVGCIQ